MRKRYLLLLCSSDCSGQNCILESTLCVFVSNAVQLGLALWRCSGCVRGRALRAGHGEVPLAEAQPGHGGHLKQHAVMLPARAPSYMPVLMETHLPMTVKTHRHTQSKEKCSKTLCSTTVAMFKDKIHMFASIKDGASINKSK